MGRRTRFQIKSKQKMKRQKNRAQLVKKGLELSNFYADKCWIGPAKN